VISAWARRGCLRVGPEKKSSTNAELRFVSRKPLELSVIFPALNEAENLPELVRRTTETLNKLYDTSQWEMLIINDYSRDNTLEVAQQLLRSYKNLKIFTHRKRRGQGGAFETGFAQASGRIVVTMDADLQVFPEDVPKLLSKIQAGYDVVNANRSREITRALPSISEFSLVLASMIYNRLMRLCYHIPLQDFASNFTAIRAEYVNGLRLGRNDNRYIIPIVAKIRGAQKLTEVLVRTQERRRGKTKYSVAKKFLLGLPEFLNALWRIHFRPRTIDSNS